MKNSYNIMLVAVLSLLFCACEKNMKPNQEHAFGPLILTADEKSSFVSDTGIDSDIQYIVLNSKDTLHLEYGRRGIIDDLAEGAVTVLPLSEKESMEKLAGHKIENNEWQIWTEGTEQQYDTDYGIFLKNYYMYDTINGMVVKIVQPKRVGNGKTGVYIPKLKDGKSFSMYGKNLDSAAHEATMQIIRSIRYR